MGRPGGGRGPSPAAPGGWGGAGALPGPSGEGGELGGRETAAVLLLSVIPAVSWASVNPVPCVHFLRGHLTECFKDDDSGFQNHLFSSK